MMDWRRKTQTLYRKVLLTFGQCDLCGNGLSTDFTFQQTNNSQTLLKQSLPKQSLLCSSCLADLPVFKQTVIQGDLLNWPKIDKALPDIHFDHLVCLSPYLPPFTQWLPQLKYQGRFELASLLSNLLAKLFLEQVMTKVSGDTPIDLILSVPLHSRKWQIRGYNQAHLLAKPLANLLQLPYDETLLKRVINNMSQVGQSGKQRRKNLTNAFQLTKLLPTHIKHVMLIDDVITTGSTTSEISKLLKRAGAEKITVATICLTLPNN